MIPAHNPRIDYLQLVFDALRVQTLPLSEWELVVVDNKSEPPLQVALDLSWHPRATVVREEALGLARAMVAGFRSASGDLIVVVADDGVLKSDYLEEALRISAAHPYLGTWSGQIDLRLEDPSTPPPSRLRSLLCERKVLTPVWSNDPSHVPSTPWGVGMCVRCSVAKAYIDATKNDARRLRLDLQGNRIAYGGDTDIAYTGCAIGLGIGVFPQLKLTHLIPKHRCSTEYLLKVLQARAYSEILHSWVMTGVVQPERSDLRGRIGVWLRWLSADSLGRKMIQAKWKGYVAARLDLRQ
jgi:glycosyltransferase involved in cell wall biosynthesis